MTPVQVKLIAALVVVAGVFTAGWQVRGWHEDSKQLAATEAMQRAIDAALGKEAAVAKVVEDRLATLQANQTTIDRGVIREIVKPEYRTVCLPDNAVRLLNAAGRGEAVPAEPDEALPGSPAGPR